MFSLNLLLSLLLSTWNDLGHLPDTQGNKGIYLDYVGPIRPPKSYGVGWVAHKILETALSPKSSFLLGLDLGLWTWTRACQY